MTVNNANKGEPLSMPEVKVEPEINVVAYDEEEPAVVPAVFVGPAGTSTTAEHTTTGSNVNNNPTSPAYSNNQQQQQYHDDHRDSGCDCVLCGDTRTRRISPGFNMYVSLCGDTHIDIHDSEFPVGSKLTLLVIRLCGNMNLCVPPGTHVVVRRLLLCGNVRRKNMT